MSGGQSSSKAKSKNSNQANFSQNIPGFQQTALTNLYGDAQKLFGESKGQLNSMQPATQTYINDINQSALPAFQSALGGGVYGGLNIGDTLKQSLSQSLNAPSQTGQLYADMMGGQGNNYADAMKASFTGDANRAYSNMLSNLDARAAASDMSGGSRHGVATSQGLYDINSNLQKNLADVGYNTFDKDLQNKLSIAQMADSNTLSRQSMLSDMLSQQQGTINQGLQGAQDMQNLGMGAFAPAMMPWEALSNYANAIGSPTVLSSGNSSGSGSSKAMGQSSSAGLT